MFDSLLSLVLRAFPSTFLERTGSKLLRASSEDFRAFAEIFLNPYVRGDWNSGLGDSVYALYGLTRALKPQVVVEIGSARGKSTCALALACRQNGTGKVYAIDPHVLNVWSDYSTGDETLSFLLDRLAAYDLGGWCEIIRTTSREAVKSWRAKIDLLFIDGDHSYEGVSHDFSAFRPWLTERSLVLFHDSAWEHHRNVEDHRRHEIGVPRYLKELQESGYHSVTLQTFPGLTILDPRIHGFEFVPSVVGRSGKEA